MSEEKEACPFCGRIEQDDEIHRCPVTVVGQFPPGVATPGMAGGATPSYFFEK